MYAVVVKVSIAPGQFESARKELQSTVVPRVRQAPGFVKGYWTAAPDGKSGRSMVIFSTKSDAENAAKMVGSAPPGAGVTIAGVEVQEVTAEA